MPEAVEGEVAGDGKKERFGRSDFAALTGAQESQVGFLHKIVEIVLGAEAVAQPSPQHRLVRLHMGGKPLAKFGIGRGHGGNRSESG